MKTKIISILILISLLVSTIGITGSASQTFSTVNTGSDPSKTIEVAKLIKNGSEWVTGLEAVIGSVVRFKIIVTYHDTDGPLPDGIGWILVDIVIKDILPEGLEYAGNPSEPYDHISSDGKNITWNVDENLRDNESYIIEFDVLVTDTGEQINRVNVSAIENCYEEQRWGEANAIVYGEKEDEDLPTVEITRPTPYHWYLFNIELESSEYKPWIVGPIKVEADATSDKGIEKVEFYLNDEEKPRKTDFFAPYNWFWILKPLGKEKAFTITVKAYDKDGNSNTTSIEVTRARLLPIFIIGGLIGYLYLKNRETPSEDETIPVEPGDSNMEPVVDAGGPYSGVVEKPVIFDASGSYDPEGNSLSYSWDFGDGSKGSGKAPSHTYTEAGRYTLTLTVTDSNGSSASATTYVDITEGGITEEAGDLPYEDDIFWYIVSGLATGLIVLVGLLYFRRRLYV
jgi:hypothetical protein